MVQLKRTASGYELSDKTATVGFNGREIKLDGQTITEPGEYEVAGVEVVYGNQAALIVWEHLQIAYLLSSDAPGNFEKDQFSSSDVVIIGDDLPALGKHVFDELMSAYDPKIVIASHQTKLEDNLKSGLKWQENSAIKLSDVSLPEEGRDFYLAS